jgi:hypothetical protein
MADVRLRQVIAHIPSKRVTSSFISVGPEACGCLRPDQSWPVLAHRLVCVSRPRTEERGVGPAARHKQAGRTLTAEIHLASASKRDLRLAQ